MIVFIGSFQCCCRSWSSEDDMIRNNLNSCSSRSESDSQQKRENSENIGTSIKSFSAKFKNENNSFKTGVLQQSVQQTAGTCNFIAI